MEGDAAEPDPLGVNPAAEELEAGFGAAPVVVVVTTARRPRLLSLRMVVEPDASPAALPECCAENAEAWAAGAFDGRVGSDCCTAGVRAVADEEVEGAAERWRSTPAAASNDNGGATCCIGEPIDTEGVAARTTDGAADVVDGVLTGARCGVIWPAPWPEALDAGARRIATVAGATSALCVPPLASAASMEARSSERNTASERVATGKRRRRRRRKGRTGSPSTLPLASISDGPRNARISGPARGSGRKPEAGVPTERAANRPPARSARGSSG